MKRIRNCIGILMKALINSDVRPSDTDFAARKRWTWLWSQPKYESIRNSPPINPDQFERRAHRHPRREFADDDEQHDKQSREDDDHLLHVGPCHGLHAAEHRVKSHDQADRQRRLPVAPTK